MRSLLASHWLTVCGIVVVALAASACSPSSDPEPETTSTTVVSTTAPSSTTPPSSTTTTSVAVAEPAVDLSKVPFVEFHPIGPRPPGSPEILPDGSIDYMDLFDLESPWITAASHVDLFKLHAWQVRHILSDDELLTIIGNLEERGIPMALEMEPLEHPDPSVCDHTESFEGKYDLEMAQKIKDLGGTIAVVSLDEPYSHAHKYTGPGACQYSVDRVVDEVILFNEQLRDIFPDVLIGSIEPYGTYAPMDADDIGLWLDTYEERSGEPFAFMHIDVEWFVDGWPEVVRSMEAAVEERGIPFGVIYNASEQITTNDEWIAAVAESFAIYETQWDGSPDHVVFQSWTPQPDYVLPDDSMTSFTGLIRRYFSNRTDISSVDISATDAGVVLSGSLATLDGDPIADAPIRVDALPLEGTNQTVTVTGVVPSNATAGVAVFRVNAEGGIPGPSDIRAYELSYSESGSGVNLIPNADFSRGMQAWYAGGTNPGTVDVVRSDIGSGSMMSLVADPDQDNQVDGEQFTVTGGALFEFSAHIGFDTESFDTGIVSVVFLDETEIIRNQIHFRPHSIELGETTTAVDGTFSFALDAVPPGSYDFSATYPGDIAHWPAISTGTFAIQ